MTNIRKIDISDSQNIVRWRNIDRVRLNLLNSDKITIEQQLQYYEKYIASNLIHQFIIFYDGKDCGTTFLKNIDFDLKTAEFGIFIGEEWALGKGVSFEATKKTLVYGFDKLKLDSIYLHVFPNNLPALSLYKKIGFLHPLSVDLSTKSGDKKSAIKMTINRESLVNRIVK